MKFSLGTILFGIGILVAAMLMIVRKSFFGLLIVLAMALLYFVLTIVSEALKLKGGKAPGADRRS